MTKNALSNQDLVQKTEGEETAESHDVQIYHTMKIRHSRIYLIVGRTKLFQISQDLTTTLSTNSLASTNRTTALSHGVVHSNR